MKILDCSKYNFVYYKIQTNNGNIFIGFINSRIIRVIYTFSNEIADSSFMILENEGEPVAICLLDSMNEISFTTSDLVLLINKETAVFSYFTIDGKLLCREPLNAKQIEQKEVYKTCFDDTEEIVNEITKDGYKTKARETRKIFDRYAYSANLLFAFQQDEALYGLGSHDDGYMNLRGTCQHLYQQNFKSCIPMITSTMGYGLLFDCLSYMKFQDDNQGSMMYCDVVDQLDYYFIYGENLDGVVKGNRTLTGKSPMLPKWAFGYLQSKERYETADEITGVATEFRQREIPIDLIILDWKSWEGDLWGQKTFDRTRFPDPKEMINQLHKLNIKFMISIWPNFFAGGENYKEMLEHGYLLPNKSTYDAFDEDARKLFWEQANEGLFSNGVDAWWCDCTEPFESDWIGCKQLNSEERLELNVKEFKKYIDPQEINAFSLYHSEGIYSGQRSTTNEKRVVNLTRSAYAGQQRYSTITWSGDISAKWQVLYKQIATGINFCASGSPYWTFDIGAFFVAKNPEMWFWDGDYDKGCKDLGYRELYTRWLQLGTFMPIFRSHGTDTPREPWRFGEKGTPYYDSILKYINLRYSLIPYIYSTSAEVYLNDYTMLRALAFDFTDMKVYDIKDQFLFGKYFMISPVTKPMYYGINSQPLSGVEKTRETYLPSGCDWYDFNTNDFYRGGQTVSTAAPIDILPLFVKAGAVIPMCKASQSTHDIDGSAIVLNIYSGADGFFTLYDDEGDNYNYENSAYTTIGITWNDKQQTLTINKRKGSYPGMKQEIVFTLNLIGNSHINRKEITYCGEELSC